MTERTYECMVLLDNREVKSNWESLHGSLEAIFTKHGAKVLSSKPWGERRLAYPIKRQTRATYLLNYLEARPDQVMGIRRDLHFNEAVLRDLVLVCDQVPEDVFGVAEFDPSSVHTEDLPEMPAAEPVPEGGDVDASEVMVEDLEAPGIEEPETQEPETQEPETQEPETEEPETEEPKESEVPADEAAGEPSEDEEVER